MATGRQYGRGNQGGGGPQNGGPGGSNFRQHRDHENEIIRGLVRHLEVLDREKDDLKRKKDALKRERDDAVQQHQTAELGRANAEKNRDTLRQQKMVLERDRDAKQQELGRLNTQFEQERRNHDGRVKDLEERHRQKIAAKDSNITLLFQNNDELKKEIRNRDFKISSLEQELSDTRKRLKHDNEKLQEKKKELEQHVEELEHRNTRLEQQIRELDKQLNFYIHKYGWRAMKCEAGQLSDMVVNGSLIYLQERDSGNIRQLDTVSSEQTTLTECPLPHTTLGVVNSQLVAVGGEIRELSTEKTVRFDISTNQWESLGEMHTARSYAVVVASGNVLIAVGGLCKGQFTDNVPTNRVEIFHWKTRRWHTATDLPISISRQTHTAVVYSNQLCVFPTTTDSSQCYICLLLTEERLASLNRHSPPIELSWQQLTNTPPATVRTCYSFDDKLFIVGRDSGNNLNCVYLWDKSCSQWQALTSDLPQGDSSLAVAMHDQQLALVTFDPSTQQVDMKRIERTFRKTFAAV